MITNEKKLSKDQWMKVLSLYIGCSVKIGSIQPVRLTKINTEGETVGGVHEEYGFMRNGIWLLDGTPAVRLILKPLSEITESDLTEIAKMYGGIRAKLDDLHLQVIDANNMVPKWFYLKGDIPHTLVDFLRSKSYMLPYMGIDLFESGIAIPNN